MLSRPHPVAPSAILENDGGEEMVVRVSPIKFDGWAHLKEHHR